MRIAPSLHMLVLAVSLTPVAPGVAATAPAATPAVAASPEQGSWGPGRLRGMNTYGSFTQEDLNTLRAWGADHIRHQIIRPDLVQEKGEWTFGPKTWQQLDTLLQQARAAGLRVILDFHQHNALFPDKLWEASAIEAWRDPAQRAKLAQLWTNLARRYQDDRETIAAFEILNEPHPPRNEAGWDAWSQVAREVTRAIRAVDGWHTIVVSGPEFSRPKHMLKVTPTGDPNTVYTFHMYEPTEFTHQGIEWMKAPFGQAYPGTIPLGWDNKTPTAVDREWLRESMAAVVEFQRQHKARIWVGEFSVRRFAPENSAYRWLKDVTDFFEEQGWDWSYHCYRGDRYGDTQWSVEHSTDQEDKQRHATTDRLELLKSLFKRGAR